MVWLIVIGFRFKSKDLTKVIRTARTKHLIDSWSESRAKLLLTLVAPELFSQHILLLVFLFDHLLIIEVLEVILLPAKILLMGKEIILE